MPRTSGRRNSDNEWYHNLPSWAKTLTQVGAVGLIMVTFVMLLTWSRSEQSSQTERLFKMMGENQSRSIEREKNFFAEEQKNRDNVQKLADKLILASENFQAASRNLESAGGKITKAAEKISPEP